MLCALSLLACSRSGDAPTTLIPISVASIAVSTGVLSLGVGTTATLTATPRSLSGVAITGRTVTWTSRNPDVASVASTGAGTATVTGVAPGVADIAATVDGISGTTTVSVAVASDALTGTVSSTAGEALAAGGAVEVFDSTGATRIAMVPVSPTGAFGTNALPAGRYRLVLHPPPSFSMGPAETAFRTGTVPGAAPVAFRVQPALWFDDFQRYADSAALHANFGVAASVVERSFFPAGQITLDPTGGPSGSRAMRYNFVANGNRNQDLWTVLRFSNATTTGAAVDTLWLRFTTRESPGFETGCGTCGNFAYKFFLVGIGRSIGFPNTASGRFGMYLQGPASAQTMGADMNDRNPDNLGYAGHEENVRHAMGPASGWTGTWNTWLIRIAFTDASTATLTLFRNGRQIATSLTNRYRTSLNDRALVDIELGSTLNSGPTVPQQRWWREVGIYRTRPSMIPLVP